MKRGIVMNTEIGKEISKRRRAKGLTQADIAAKLGVSVQAVSKWERGLSKPRMEILDKLACFLNLKVETQLTKKKSPWLIRFISAFYYDAIKTICIGVMIASVACLLFGFTSSEVAIAIIGAATSLFSFLTILKQT